MIVSLADHSWLFIKISLHQNLAMNAIESRILLLPTLSLRCGFLYFVFSVHSAEDLKHEYNGRSYVRHDPVSKSQAFLCCTSCSPVIAAITRSDYLWLRYRCKRVSPWTLWPVRKGRPLHRFSGNFVRHADEMFQHSWYGLDQFPTAKCARSIAKGQYTLRFHSKLNEAR